MDKVENMALKTLVFIYKIFRPILGPKTCRFHPTCSEYAFESLRIHGFIKALLLSLKRITRCHPFHPGGYDPVPDGTAALRPEVSEAMPTTVFSPVNPK